MSHMAREGLRAEGEAEAHESCAATIRQLIEERDEARRRQALAEVRFSTVLQASPDSVNITRLVDGVYVSVNDGFTHTFGFTSQDVVGRSSVDLGIWVNPADRERLVGGLKQRGLVENLEATFRAKNGRLVRGLMSAGLFDMDGVPCLLSITRDITAWREAEATVTARDLQLAQLIDLAIDAIILCDAEGRITLANQQAVALTGRPVSQLVGQPVASVYAPESLAEKPLRFDLLALGQVTSFERFVLRPDGGRVPVEAKGRRMPDGSLQAILRDLTAQKQAEAEHAAMRERLREAEQAESMGRLAVGIAHDFNNLLTPILSISSLMMESAHGEQDQEDLVAIRDAATRAADITRQILALGRKQVLRVEVVDLNEEVQRAERTLRHLIGEQVGLTHELAPGPLPVRVDPAQLQQVLLNLVVNARDALQPGGVITLRTRADQGCTLLEVADTGVGMDAATLARAFEPFFTTKGHRGGTGLGLATVKGVVEQHGGRLEATSAPGQGTTMRVCLPPATEPPRTPTPPPRVGPSGGTELVLVVEDEPQVRHAERAVLVARGYQVVTAASAEAALALAADLPRPPALLVTDVVLPGLNGLELVYRLHERWRGLPVLFVSGYPEGLLASQGVLADGVRLLAKPFTPDGLAAAVRDALDGMPLRRG